ncbi:MAG: dihydroxyacetone kinase subunit L [Kineosporiaceae bacterium]|nr:dihydroxyacetone kinase subunit L [Kineosporiaceae bacterium]
MTDSGEGHAAPPDPATDEEAGEIRAADLGRWLREFARLVRANRDLLTALDSAIGDADHGLNLDRGMTAVVIELDAAPRISSPATLLRTAGMTLVRTVGGASGPLYGTLLMRMAAACSAPTLSAEELAIGLRAGLDGVTARGRARPGEKTLLDALEPACAALDSALAEGTSLGVALHAARAAADAGRDATTAMVARKGRASYLGERSVGHQDPGATSMALLVTAAATSLGEPADSATAGAPGSD